MFSSPHHSFFYDDFKSILNSQPNNKEEVSRLLPSLSVAYVDSDYIKITLNLRNAGNFALKWHVPSFKDLRFSCGCSMLSREFVYPPALSTSSFSSSSFVLLSTTSASSFTFDPSEPIHIPPHTTLQTNFKLAMNEAASKKLQCPCIESLQKDCWINHSIQIEYCIYSFLHTFKQIMTRDVFHEFASSRAFQAHLDLQQALIERIKYNGVIFPDNQDLCLFPELAHIDFRAPEIKSFDYSNALFKTLLKALLKTLPFVLIICPASLFRYFTA